MHACIFCSLSLHPTKISHCMFRCLSLIMLLVVMHACKTSNKETADVGDAAKIEVSWQMVSNFIEPAQQMEAKFIFSNNGNYILGDSAWALFFNNTPRGIKAPPGSQPANVEHINGDWYKLTPNKGFSLKPRETIEIIYRCD